MKKFICVLLLICMAFAACDLFVDDDRFSVNSLAVKDTSIKSLYVSNIPASNGRAASGSTIQTLCYINENGESSPFFFITPSGKNVMLEVSSIQQLDDKRIVIDFSSYTIDNKLNVGDGSIKTALVDFERGKVYDFSGWGIYLVNNDVAFVGIIGYGSLEDGKGIIYKINLNDVSKAIPLNNNKYFNIGGIKPVVFNNSKVCSYNEYIIDINNNFPITSLKNATLNNDMCSFIPGSSYKTNFLNGKDGLTFTDYSGDTWFFIAGGKTPGLDHVGGYTSPNLGNPDKYFIGKINIDDDGQMFFTDYYEDSFSFTPDYSNNGRLFFLHPNGNSIDRSKVYVDDVFIRHKIIVMSNNGYITIDRKISGIHIETTALSLSLPDYFAGRSFIKDNYLYYLDNTTIKRIHLSAGSSAEIVYSNNRILTTENITLSGDTIFFYQFADDNISVNTYSLYLNQQNPIPILLSTSSVEIKGIVELDF